MLAVNNTLDYIVVLKDNNTSADPKTISQEYESKGAMVTHIYESALKGFAIKIPENVYIALSLMI